MGNKKVQVPERLTGLDFDSTNLADSWKRWKQELELCMYLALCGKDKATKVKFLLYLIGSQGRKIYDTMTFEVPTSKIRLTQVLAAVDAHCNPKRNETNERFKFFSCTQDLGESQKKVHYRFEAVSNDL